MGFRDVQARARERGRRMREEVAEDRQRLREERREAVDEYREARDREKAAREASARPSKRLSDVGDRSSGTLACPDCGGTDFKAKRSTRAKVLGGAAVGVGALLAPKSRVECVACGETFKRG